MRFNSLVAIEKAPSRRGHTYWKYRCDCGNEKEIQMSGVTTGAVKSCGCLLDAIRDISENAQPNDNTPRFCKICNKEFFGFLNDTRIFCYDCSPRGASVAETHKIQKRIMKHLLVEYKGGKCIECGYDKCEGALQFHHLDPKDKDFTLSLIKPNTIPMEELYREVDKCMLLCANCHVQKHFIDDKIGFIMRLPPKRDLVGESKKCIVCNSDFIAHHCNRRYCYTCVPYGIGIPAEKRARKRAMKHELLKYKSLSCESCGYDKSESALQFHHRDPDEKDFSFARINLSHLGMTMDKLKAEADKCDVLCANCHAEVHYKNGDDEFDFD